MYLGEHEVIKEKREDGKISLEIRVIVKDKDGKVEKDFVTREQYSELYYDEVKTKEPLNESDYVFKRSLFIEEQIYNTLLKHNVPLVDIRHVTQRLLQSVEINHTKAINKKWGKNEYETKTLWELQDTLK